MIPALLVATATVVQLTDQLGHPVPPPPTVLIFGAVTRSDLEDGKALDETRLRAVDEAFTEAASATYEWRRWRVVSGEDARAAIRKAGFGDRCDTLECVDATVRAVGATHWVTVVAIAIDGRDCSARAKSVEVAGQKVLADDQIDIGPCLTDNILGQIADLARKIADGPQRSQRIDLALTPLHVPSLDIADIEDVPLYRTATTARTQSGYGLDRALAVYRDKHMFAFDDGGKLYVTRGGRVLTDCEVMKVASKPVDARLRTHCSGNLWEIAYGTVPVGGLMMFVGRDGVSGGGAGELGLFITGIAVGLAGPALALIFDRDGADLADHAVPPHELHATIDEWNASLRRSLALTEAEVAVAGMRL